MHENEYIAIIPIILGLLIFTLFTVWVFISWITLPPFSFEVEGRYVGFGLLLLLYAYMLPVSCAFCLAGYLIYPPLFHRLRTPVNILSAFFIVLGIATLAILPIVAMLRSIWLVFAMIGFLAPYAMVPLLAYNVYKTSQPVLEITEIESGKSDLGISRTSSNLTLIGGALMLITQFWIDPLMFLTFVSQPSYLIEMQPAIVQLISFMLLHRAIPITTGIVVLIAGRMIRDGNLKVGGFLVIVFAIQAFSFFGSTLVLGAIIALIGGALGYSSNRIEDGA